MRYGTGDFQYELVEGWPTLPKGCASLIDVGGVAVDADDNVYVLNRSDYPVIVFDREGTPIRHWGEGFFKRAHGSFIARDGSIYCTDDGSHIVAKFNPDGEPLLVLGTRDEPSDTGYTRTWEVYQSVSTIKHAGPPFNRPTGVVVNSDGDIFVSDGYGNARVHHFSADGTLLHSWGEPGGWPGQFKLPHDIALDSKDRLLVADRENSRIQVFDQDGTFIEQWYDMVRPTGIRVDANGIVYVSEFSLRVSIFSPEGELLSRITNPSHIRDEATFLAPHTVGVDSHGDIYVGEVSKTYAGTDKGARTVQKFRRV